MPYSRNCQACGKHCRNPKYCSLKCANSQQQKKSYKCKSCNLEISVGWTGKLYCDSCRFNPERNPSYKDWSKITLGDMMGKLCRYQAHARIRSRARQVYFANDGQRVCFKCGYSKHIEVCHIKPIANFDPSTPISVINEPSNLRGLCPNCHWEMDHGLI